MTSATPTSAGPFDPIGVTWDRVSPRLTTVRLISLALVLALPLIATVAVAALTGIAGLWALPAAVVACGAWPVSYTHLTLPTNREV